MMDDPEITPEEKDYIPVHKELKQYPGVGEFYSVPKRYNQMMEADMKMYGSFMEGIRAQSKIWTESTFQILRDRIDEIWKLYMNALREGVPMKRVNYLRESMQKVMYVARTYIGLRQSLEQDESVTGMSHDVIYRRIHYVMNQLEQVVDETKENTPSHYDDWEKRFIYRLNNID